MLTVALPVNGGGLAPISGGNFLPPDLAKGGLLMSTSEVLQLCLVIIGICSLFIQAKKEVTAQPPSKRLLLNQAGG